MLGLINFVLFILNRESEHKSYEVDVILAMLAPQ